MTSQTKRTLAGLAEAIRGIEAQAAKKRIVRDRLLGQASDVALEVAALTEQAAGLREILGDLDAEAYERAFGEPFTRDEYHNVEPSREQMLTGLHDLLAFLDATPEVPVTREYWGIDLPRANSDAERIAAVDALAAVLGEEPERSSHYSGEDKQQYGVKRSFGYAKLYADVVVEREPGVPTVAEVDQADAAAAPEAGGEVLDERMLGMGEPAAEESAEEQVMHAAAYAGPHFGLESAHALCGGKGWLTEEVPLVTCTACAALLLGDEADETQRVVDAFLDGQSELDQDLVREELQRQAEAASGQEEPAGDGAPHLCGSRAVTPSGDVGVCRLDDGHDEPDSEYYDARVRVGHFDPAFGFWNGATVRRAEHTPYYGNPQLCARCGRSLPLDGYCLDGSIELAASAENLEQAVSPR